MSTQPGEDCGLATPPSLVISDPAVPPAPSNSASSAPYKPGDRGYDLDDYTAGIVPDLTPEQAAAVHDIGDPTKPMTLGRLFPGDLNNLPWLTNDDE
jgi:hypothetical protein